MSRKNGPQVNGSKTVIFTPNSLNLCMRITKWLNDTHTKFQVNRFTNKRFMGCWSARTVLGVLWFGRRFAQNASRLQVKLDWYCAAKHFPFDQFVWNFARICFRDLTIKLHIFFIDLTLQKQFLTVTTANTLSHFDLKQLKIVLAFQYPINVFLINQITWYLMWVSFNHLIFIIQNFNAFDVKMTAWEPFIWVLILLGHPVVPQ